MAAGRKPRSNWQISCMAPMAIITWSMALDLATEFACTSRIRFCTSCCSRKLSETVPSVGGQSVSLQAALYGALTSNPDLATLRLGNPTTPSAEAVEVARNFPTTLNPTLWCDLEQPDHRRRPQRRARDALREACGE